MAGRRHETVAEAPAGRLVFLDTETTGLKPENGDAVVEIGCIEMIDRTLTGRGFHAYVNPLRPLSDETIRIHGLTDALLSAHPSFPAFADSLLDFIGDATVVIHNAPFDVGFLDMEMRRAGRGKNAFSGAVKIYDSLKHARQHVAQTGVSLDALCRRYGVDVRSRKVHGALLDAWLLARVWLAMTQGQQGLDFGVGATAGAAGASSVAPAAHQASEAHARKPGIVLRANEDELAAHRLMMAQVKSPVMGEALKESGR